MYLKTSLTSVSFTVLSLLLILNLIYFSEEDIVNFFPLSRKESRVHQELTDTFSIEEMSISGDDEEEEDLHLVPPQTVYKKFACCPFTFCVIM